MPLTRAKVVKTVKKKVAETTLNDMHTYLVANPPDMWGFDKPRNFLMTSLVLALYKDIKAIGFNNLFSKIESWYPAKDRALRHNIKKVRKGLKHWGESCILRGEQADWERAASHVPRSGTLKQVNLWADSEDLALTGKSSVSKKDPLWSYKKNAPGRRYMLFCNARGRIVKLWGGYTPKLYDGNFLELNKNWLEKKMQGAEVIADQHFEWGKVHLKGLRFHVPMKRLAKKRRKGCRSGTERKQGEPDSKGISAYNALIHRLRARVENRFGVMQQKFKALAKPWPESQGQLDCLVFCAAGVINKSLQ